MFQCACILVEKCITLWLVMGWNLTVHLQYDPEMYS